MLQGPHGPFFGQLGRMLRAAGADVLRVGFNKGDEVFWRDKTNFIPFTDDQADWPARFETLLDEYAITDIVLYGDTRPIHAKAVAIAKSRNLGIHVFEEGYLRPYWVTYERDGTNGNSDLMSLGVADMQEVLAQAELDIPEAPAHWGDMRQHVFYGALYHWFVMFANRKYNNFKPHRALGVAQEFKLYLWRLLLMPYIAAHRIAATRRISRGGFPYHLALLQLEHDSSFQNHSPFNTMTDFLDVVIKGFAAGAPKHHHLVFKAHPLEDGRVPQRQEIKRIATECGVQDRRALCARWQAGPTSGPCAYSGDSQLHRRPAGAVAGDCRLRCSVMPSMTNRNSRLPNRSRRSFPIPHALTAAPIATIAITCWKAVR